MLPGPPLIFKCPHCKGEKKLMSLISGNTLGGHQWWDFKVYYPKLPKLSRVQKCPHCGKYFMLSEAESAYGGIGDYSGDLGILSHAELREAWAQMKDSLEGDPRNSFLLEYLWAFNDTFQRELPPMDSYTKRYEARISPVSPTEEEWAEFTEIVRELVASLPVENRLVYAEFLREARLFDEAMAVVEQEGEQKEAPYDIMEKIIREKCLARDSRVGFFQ